MEHFVFLTQKSRARGSAFTKFLRLFFKNDGIKEQLPLADVYQTVLASLGGVMTIPSKKQLLIDVAKGFRLPFDGEYNFRIILVSMHTYGRTRYQFTA